ncbi:hypothetical protein C8F04DRAFT_1199714 [Mycena alexandri]|uniref:F-box domain-containing protein n=1 Tax=Mycena alexandri TaxID=1745969 RepID=A0AAD6WL21_9AGAR|nr:hypothetical protein C8F04DRAFT_1199714 [Mycena alexandri]
MPSQSTTPSLRNQTSLAALLAAEILSAIFVEVVQPEVADWLDLINRRRVVVSVCRHWSAVAAGLAILWSRIHLSPPVLPYFLQECIRKAGPTADLFVDVNPHSFRTIYDNGTLRDVKFVSSEDFMTQSVELLRAIFPRVRSLAVNDGHHSELYTVMGILAGFRADGLESLWVAASQYSSVVDPAMPAGMHLKDLTLKSVHPLWTSGALYAGLTKLTLENLLDVEWLKLRAVLHGNDTLSDLHFWDVSCVGWSNANRATLPNLSLFAVRYRSNADKSFLASFVLPKLDQLDVELEGHSAILGVVDDMGALLGSAKNVWLDGWGFRGGELASVIAACTNTRVLNLRRCRPLPSPALLRLAATPHFSLPKLKLLKLSGDLKEEEALRLVSSPFPLGLVISEWVMGADRNSGFKEWELIEGNLRMRLVEDTIDGR